MQKNPLQKVNSLWYSREIYGSWQLNIVFTSGRRWHQSWARWVYYKPHHPTALRFLPMLFFQLHLDLQAVPSLPVLGINTVVEWRVSHDCHSASCVTWWCYRIWWEVQLCSYKLTPFPSVSCDFACIVINPLSLFWHLCDNPYVEHIKQQEFWITDLNILAFTFPSSTYMKLIFYLTF
jgi:hypothetical protein